MTLDIIYLSTNQIIAINAIQIKVYSPTEQIGVKDPGLIDWIIYITIIPPFS
ncbi:hypothetical protein [Peribacillus sp. R9-11]|uniref:hypothetical protein n=1 Tax=Peribacillus sp. R9-11 TaxID=3073271 RepID=UPI00286929F1|nr:hypothetical protein [Peribacillus sp. R9-11]WMX58699.1 hypothetical protein RE409_28035 [Peribacillus sp. R9-11]